MDVANNIKSQKLASGPVEINYFAVFDELLQVHTQL
jgi:hypothetical protein